MASQIAGVGKVLTATLIAAILGFSQGVLFQDMDSGQAVEATCEKDLCTIDSGWFSDGWVCVNTYQLQACDRGPSGCTTYSCGSGGGGS